MGKPSKMISSILALLLAGCAGSPSDQYHRSTGQDESWGVGATHPRYDSLRPCDEDPSVEIAVLSDDMPTSRLGMRLLPGSTEEDALRVADCLAITLTGGEIWITSPSSSGS